mmetsp:Transcript_78980/g.139416  ORF Transcript_78980/g.139416 Transcript_78980/m.139416 type:complete len:512 (-) Transcript_78980:230-1765(-)
MAAQRDDAEQVEGQHFLVADLEALQARIMADIQAKLSQKEESLWRRGQVEINRLQHGQQEVTATIAKMQAREEELVKENSKIRGALVEVTNKFEQVVKQMREVLRALPAQQQAAAQTLGNPQQQSSMRNRHQMRLSPSPSEASTAASGEAAREVQEQTASREEPTPGGSSTAGASSSEQPASQTAWSDRSRSTVMNTPLAMWHGPRGILSAVSGPESVGQAESAKRPSEAKTFCTPPRHAGSSPQEDFMAAGLGVPLSWQTPVLSLAEALPSSSAPFTSSPISDPLKVQSTKADSLLQTPPLPTMQSQSSSSGLVLTSPTSGKENAHVRLELVKDGFTTLGIEVDQDNGSLLVGDIDEHGLVGRFNKAQEAQGEPNKILIGDRIIEVNGVRQDPNRMLHECKVGQRLIITLARIQSAAAAMEGSPNPTKMRPEAQVFVPSAQKEPEVSAPPGLELPVATSSATAFLATSPQMLQSAPHEEVPTGAAGAETVTSAALPSVVEEPEVRRALFR